MRHVIGDSIKNGKVFLATYIKIPYSRHEYE